MTRIIAKICIRRKCTSQTIHEFFVKPAKRAFSCTAKAVFVTLRLVVGRRPKGRRGAWRRSFPRSDRGYRMRHLSDLLANALPRPFRRRNAARQAGSVSWSRVIRPRRQASGCLSAKREPRRGRKGPSANTVSQPPTRSTCSTRLNRLYSTLPSPNFNH